MTTLLCSLYDIKPLHGNYLTLLPDSNLVIAEKRQEDLMHNPYGKSPKLFLCNSGSIRALKYKTINIYNMTKI